MTRARILADYVSSGDELAAVATTANAALPKAGGAMTGAITTNSTFDGIDIATDVAANTAKVSFTPDAAQVFNDTGADVDFRIESDDDANVFFVDGGEDRIGIGENVPLGKLHIKTADSGATANAVVDELVVEGSGDSGIQILSGATSSSRFLLGNSGANNSCQIKYDHNLGTFYIFTNAGATSAFTIDASDHIGMNRAPYGNVILGIKSKTSDSASYALFMENLGGSNLLYIRSDGYTWAYQAWATSDRNKKENIRYLDEESILDKINQLKLCRFDYIDGMTDQVGFIAQDVETIFPDIVSNEPTPNSDEIVKGLNYGYLGSYLVKAVQELSAKNDALEAENTALKTRMDALEARVLALES